MSAMDSLATLSVGRGDDAAIAFAPDVPPERPALNRPAEKSTGTSSPYAGTTGPDFPGAAIYPRK